MAYSITIAGTDRTGDVLHESIVIEDVLNDEQNTLSFSLIDLSGSGIPETNDEVIITMADDTKLFGGYVVNVLLNKSESGTVRAEVQCMDYVALFDRNLVHRTYEDMTDKEIIESILNEYCSGFGLTSVNVVEGVTIDQLTINYLQPSQVLRKICDLTARNWYIDYDKDVHYFPLTTNAAPFNITSTNNEYSGLVITKDASQLKNRVYVRGGTKLSDFTTYSVKGDGVATKFPLPDKPHDVTVTVNDVEKTVGIKNIDLTGYDWYLNYNEKYLEQDSGGSVLTTSDTLEVTYKYDIPILVAVENSASILENGVKEFAIFDKQIETTQAARDRASAELTDYANRLIEGEFETYSTGFRSGQYIHITLSEYDLDDDYLVQKVVAKAFGAGNFVYRVYLASAKTMGIIRFLIEMLEANKNLIELDDDEVVDELLNKADVLLSDSLLDSLVIDSAGPYRVWCEDSLTDWSTRARWDLFGWG